MYGSVWIVTLANPKFTVMWFYIPCDHTNDARGWNIRPLNMNIEKLLKYSANQLCIVHVCCIHCRKEVFVYSWHSIYYNCAKFATVEHLMQVWYVNTGNVPFTLSSLCVETTPLHCQILIFKQFNEDFEKVIWWSVKWTTFSFKNNSYYLYWYKECILTNCAIVEPVYGGYTILYCIGDSKPIG